MKANRIRKKVHEFPFSCLLVRRSDWSVKMRLLGFPAKGHEPKSAKTFHSYLFVILQGAFLDS